MNKTYKKKLIEVALPLEAINAACIADKERKTGHIRNIHKWFAPMPLPALRAILCATILEAPDNQESLSKLLSLIANLVLTGPDSPPEAVLQCARSLLNSQLPSSDVCILDPFCGGGSTLVEAQRLGLSAEGSDLNPIPVMISRVLTELPLRNLGRKPLTNLSLIADSNDLSGFLTDIRAYANRVRETVSNDLQYLYPSAPNGDPVIYWWWAHTVPSPVQLLSIARHR